MLRIAMAVVGLVGSLAFVGSGAAELGCVPQDAIDVSTIRTQIVMVGERHGTKEIPAFMSGLVCSLLRADRSVILALETDGAEQDAVNRYLSSEGTAGDRAAYLRSERWQDECQDGRKSIAMLALIEAVRGWKKSGQRVTIAMIGSNENVRAPLTQAEETTPLPAKDALRMARISDRSLANNLMETAILYRGYTVVSLSGFNHSATLKGNAGDPDFLPMGALVAREEPVHVIGFATGAGSSWNSGPSGCKETSIPAQDFYRDGTQIDTLIRLPAVTASPPARDTVR